MSTDEEVNPYELLSVELETPEAEIRKAYRTKSLKVHPDRVRIYSSYMPPIRSLVHTLIQNRNDPNAAKKFHELNQAYELLLDPLRRLALDAKIRIKNARKERFKSYDAKRKNLVDDLEERERAFKKAKVERDKDEVRRWTDTERIKEEGKRMMEEREAEIRRRDEESIKASMQVEEEDAPPALGVSILYRSFFQFVPIYICLGEMDTTVRVKYTLVNHPTLISPQSLSTFLSQFGSTDCESIVLSLKPPKKSPDKPAKFATALVPFNKIGDAFAAVCASGREDRGLGNIDIGWPGGKEPEILGWLKKNGKLGGETKTTATAQSGTTGGKEKANTPQFRSLPADSSPYSSFPSTFVSS